MTSKELREYLRNHFRVRFPRGKPEPRSMPLIASVWDLLDALDAEEAKRRAPQIVGMATDSLEIYGPTPVYERPPEDDPAPESGP